MTEAAAPTLEVAEDALALANPRRPTMRGIPDLIACAVSIPAGIVLLQATQGTLALVTSAVFAASLTLLLLTSGMYHTITWSPSTQAIWSRFDHAAIFFLIAGTYTPFSLCSDLPMGPHVLGLVWAGALVGAGYCIFRPRGSRTIRATLYVVIGVAMVPFVTDVYASFPPEAFWLCFGGGASYILGAVIYVKKWPNPSPKHYGYHEVFHLFVFGGAIAHYFAVWTFVT